MKNSIILTSIALLSLISIPTIAQISLRNSGTIEVNGQFDTLYHYFQGSNELNSIFSDEKWREEYRLDVEEDSIQGLTTLQQEFAGFWHLITEHQEGKSIGSIFSNVDSSEVVLKIESIVEVKDCVYRSPALKGTLHFKKHCYLIFYDRLGELEIFCVLKPAKKTEQNLMRIAFLNKWIQERQ